MENAALFERLRTVVSRHTSKLPDEALRPLVCELWEMRDREAPADQAQLASIAGIGAHYLAAGGTASQAVRDVLQLGRALVEDAQAASGAETASRLQGLVDEAAVQVARAIELARRSRRQSWLSFLVHELKNPLNTVMNALWLIREKGSDPAQTARFLELAERAVKRLEARSKDVRQLDEDLMSAPPGWQPLPGVRDG